MSERRVTRTQMVIVGLIVFIIIFIVPYQMKSLSMIVPGPEGVRAMNYGVQFPNNPNNKVLDCSVPDPMPSGYSWGMTGDKVMTFKHQDLTQGNLFVTDQDMYKYGPGEIRSEVSRPLFMTDPLKPTQTLTYDKKIRISSNQVEIHRFTVNIIPAEFVIQISAVPSQEGVYTWTNTRIWYVLDTVVWENAFPGTLASTLSLENSSTVLLASNYRGAFPILGWIDKYQDWTWTKPDGSSNTVPPDSMAAAFCQLDPSLEGREITLYTAPDSTYNRMLSSDIVNDEEFLRKALEPNNLPDPRFAQTVYFYITLTNFGAYIHHTGFLGMTREIYFPAVYYRLRVVYAVYGEWVYLWTAQSAAQVGYYPETWQVRNATKVTQYDPITKFWLDLSSAFNNWISDNWAKLGGFTMLIVGVIVVITLWWFFGWPSRGKEGGGEE